MPITQPISRNNRKPFDKYGHNASRLYRSYIGRNLIPSYLFMCDIDQIKFQRELFFSTVCAQTHRHLICRNGMHRINLCEFLLVYKEGSYSGSVDDVSVLHFIWFSCTRAKSIRIWQNIRCRRKKRNGSKNIGNARGAHMFLPFIWLV